MSEEKKMCRYKLKVQLSCWILPVDVLGVENDEILELPV